MTEYMHKRLNFAIVRFGKFGIANLGRMLGGVLILVVGINVFRYPIRVAVIFLDTVAVVCRIVPSNDAEEEDRVYVNYEVNGVEYRNVSAGSGDYSVGAEIVVRYNPGNPRELAVTGLSSGGGALFLYCVGSMLNLAGGGITAVFLFPFFRKIRGHQMRKRFRPVYAKIERVSVDNNISVFGENLWYRIYVSYMKDGNLCEFRSERIVNDPTDDIFAAKLTKLPVYVDWNEPTRYFVDTDVIYNIIFNLTY